MSARPALRSGAGARDVQFKAQLLSVTPEDPSEIIALLQNSNSADISKRPD
jgi:hypothetical protein